MIEKDAMITSRTYKDVLNGSSVVTKAICKPPPGLEHALDGSAAFGKTFKPAPGLADVLNGSSAMTECCFKAPPGLEDVLMHKDGADNDPTAGTSMIGKDPTSRSKTYKDVLNGSSVVTKAICKPPPGLENALDGSAAFGKTFKPAPGLADVLDGPSAMTECCFKAPPGLEDVLMHKGGDESCHSACDGSSHLDGEAVDDRNIITRCTLLAIRLACRVHVHSQSSERGLITLMHREHFSQERNGSSTLDSCTDVGDSSVCRSEGNCVCSDSGPVGKLADDLEGSILHVTKQQIADMNMSLIKGTGAVSIVSRSNLFFIGLAMLFILLVGCIALAVHSNSEEGKLSPIALFILRAEVGLRAHFTPRTQNAPSFLAPIYDQLLPSSAAGPSPSASSVQLYAGI
jgi:hypothetical protein